MIIYFSIVFKKSNIEMFFEKNHYVDISNDKIDIYKII